MTRAVPTATTHAESLLRGASEHVAPERIHAQRAHHARQLDRSLDLVAVSIDDDELAARVGRDEQAISTRRRRDGANAIVETKRASHLKRRPRSAISDESMPKYTRSPTCA